MSAQKVRLYHCRRWGCLGKLLRARNRYLRCGRFSGFDNGILMAALSKSPVAALFSCLIATFWQYILKNVLKF